MALVQCVDPSSGHIQARWSFADGRDCASSGVASVELQVVDKHTIFVEQFQCAEGFTEAILLGEFGKGVYQIIASGYSFEGSLLYSQDLLIRLPGESTFTAEIELFPSGKGR